MDPRTEEADAALEAFRASRSEEGRFLAYCRGRSRHFWTRQILTLVVIPALLALTGVLTTLVAAAAVLSAEALDCALLRRIGKRDSLGGHLRLARAVTTLTGAVQALSVTASVSLIYFHGRGDTVIFVGAIYMAAMFDAAMLFGAHKAASLVRVAIYAIGTAMLVLLEAVRIGGFSTELTYDTAAAAFLVYVGWLIVGHIFMGRERQNAARLATLEKARELAHANAALESSRNTTRRLALVAERANDSVVMTDGDGTISWVNRAFSETTGYSFAEAVGRNVRFLNGPETDPVSSNRLERARIERRPVRLEIVNHHRNGHAIWVEVNMAPLFDDAGDLMCFVSIERDISEAKQRERALAEARSAAEDAVRARHNFLAIMSHEIRTPMNGVIGTADLLLDTDLDQQQEALVKTLASSGDALLGIVNDILDFSKLEAGRFEVASEPFTPGECFRSVIDLIQPLADSKGLELRAVLPASLPERVVGDGLRLRQVLLNVVSNAVKFTEKGSVTLEVSVRLHEDKCGFLISVRDTGIGIPAERCDSIFDSFTQADSRVAGRFGGTGLGLSISRLLVEVMGGEITVASRPGEGSVFFVTLELPVAALTPDRASETDLPGEVGTVPVDLRGKRVLVAEDNRTNMLLIERILAGFGVTTIPAENGRDAIGLQREQRPDAVFMDMHMPILDGLAATREIRAFEAEQGMARVPIIAFTANAFPEDRDLCFDAGMDGIVTKPFRKRDILDALAAALASGPAPPETALTDAVGEGR